MTRASNTTDSPSGAGTGSSWAKVVTGDDRMNNAEMMIIFHLEAIDTSAEGQPFRLKKQEQSHDQHQQAADQPGAARIFMLNPNQLQKKHG